MSYVFRKKSKRAAARVFDAAGQALFRVLPATGERPAPSYKKVVVLRLDHLGDVLGCIGLPKALKESFPGARVTMVVSPDAAPLLENNPFVDELIRFQAPWFARGGRGDRFGALAARLRRERFDLGLSLRGDLRENFLLWKAGVTERVGYGITGGGFFLNHQVRYRPGEHQRQHLRTLLASVGLRSASLEPRIYFSDEERSGLARLLSEWGMAAGVRYVGFQPVSGTAAKDWPAERSAEFARLFAARAGGRARLVLVGKQAGEPIGGDAIDLRGRTGLRQMLMLFTKLEAFVGPDSGPTHIAASTGLRTVFLYSGTNRIEEWGPVWENSRVLTHPVPCAPCSLTRCPVKGHPCMSGIEARTALEAVDRLGVLS